MNRDLITTDSGRYYDTNQALWEPLEGFELRRDTPPAPPVYDPAALGAEGGTRGEAGWVPFPRNMPRPPDAVDDILDDIGTGTRGEAGWVPFSAVTPIPIPGPDPLAAGVGSTLIPPPPALVNPYQVNVPVGNAPPPPLNEEEAGKLHNGLEYKTGYWTGGSWDKWDSLSPELKKITMSSDWWMEGGTFNPEQPASSFIWGDGGRQSSAFPTGSAD